MKTIAVLGASSTLEPFYRQTKNLGYRIVGIAWPEGAVCLKYCDVFYPVSYADREKVLEICIREKVDGITSFVLETALPTLVYVAGRMGLVSNTQECVELTATKYAQRQAFRLNGIPVPGFCSISSEDQLPGLGLEYPLILKPEDGGGSRGINKVENNEELLPAFLASKACSRNGSVIVEQYVDGREFSVEYISHNGRHYLLQITDKVTSGSPHFIEMAHHQPADITPQLKGRIKDMVERALTALKIENSPSHTEIKLNSRNELFIIEVGARMGGGHITSDLVRLSTGYDMVRGALELAVGSFSEPVFGKQMYSGVFFFSSLAPQIGDIIRNSFLHPEIVECEITQEPLNVARSNADRNGYLLYQSADGRKNY